MAQKIDAQRLAAVVEDQKSLAKGQTLRIFDYDAGDWRDMTPWEIARAKRYLERAAKRKAWQDEQDRLLNEATKINAAKAKGSASQQRRAAAQKTPVPAGLTA